jgi:hypothetical protein
MMSDETVKVACCLPHGPVLEIGKPGESTFKSFELTGVLAAGNNVATFPNRKGLKFGISKVPADIWNAWYAKNKTLRYIVDKSVFVA